MTRTLRRAVCLVAAVTLVGACGKKKTPAAPPPPPAPAAGNPAPAPATPPRPAPAPVPPATGLDAPDAFARMSLDELNASRPLRDVFFEYDEAVLSDAARAELAANADWLRRQPTTRVRIEGHCDERGTTEYNLSLGERRAAAVRTYLVTLGIPTDRVAIVSRGEELPFCPGHGESCWSQNRRGHFLITAK